MRTLTFATQRAKAAWLCQQLGSDAGSASVKRVAEAIGHIAQDVGRSRADRARLFCELAHRWSRDTIRYIGDYTGQPGTKEQFAPPDFIIARGYDDCDGKARIVAAVVVAGAHLGFDVQAQIHPVFRGEDFVHVQALVRYPGSAEHPSALDGGWLLSDPIVCGAELGDGPERFRRPDGRVPTC